MTDARIQMSSIRNQTCTDIRQTFLDETLRDNLIRQLDNAFSEHLAMLAKPKADHVRIQYEFVGVSRSIYSHAIHELSRLHAECTNRVL